MFYQLYTIGRLEVMQAVFCRVISLVQMATGGHLSGAVAVVCSLERN